MSEPRIPFLLAGGDPNWSPREPLRINTCRACLARFTSPYGEPRDCCSERCQNEHVIRREAQTFCNVCGVKIERTGMGRPRWTCSDACMKTRTLRLQRAS